MLNNDIQILRDLAKQYRELTEKPIQEQRRTLWTDHFSLKKTPPPIVALFGMWNAWCRELFADNTLKCQDPFYRRHEQWFHIQLFQDSINDDTILEPWISQRAIFKAAQGNFGEPWGAPHARHGGESEGSWTAEPYIKKWVDVAKLTAPAHVIDEEATAEAVRKLQDAVGDILEVDVNRGPILHNFSGDISTTLGGLRGIQQMMMDMYEAPDELHALLAFLRDGVLANQQQAEDAGDFSLTAQHNQAMTYAGSLERPKANSGPCKRSQVWGFCASQEFTLVSPQFHDEFLFQYQIPIFEKYGLVHYGCCEDLTQKIDMLRQLKTLRSIAVAPRAYARKCAEQIGTDYVLSWRPNPTMVCSTWESDQIRKSIREGLDACKDSIMHVSLKDIENLEHEPDRLGRWIQIIREEIDRA